MEMLTQYFDDFFFFGVSDSGIRVVVSSIKKSKSLKSSWNIVANFDLQALLFIVVRTISAAQL